MYRTINQTLDIIRKNDANTAITAYFLRKLCKSGQIQTLNAGGKYLINVKSLSDFLKMDLKEN